MRISPNPLAGIALLLNWVKVASGPSIVRSMTNCSAMSRSKSPITLAEEALPPVAQGNWGALCVPVAC